MINSDGIVKIIDFNISKPYKSADAKDKIIRGIAGYAPYEQYDIKKLSQY